MLIADRLYIPENTRAILWDMDGVLLDTLGLDITVCNKLLKQYFGNHINLTKEFIRSIFAYHPPEFWRLILEFVESEYKLSKTEIYLNEILETYNKARSNAVFKVNVGICEILEHIEKIRLTTAVVSNNPTEDVKTILSKSGILAYFNSVIGNDIKHLKKKPSPDTYLFAASALNVVPEECVVIEDSLIGTEAGYRANCYTIGVATGGDDFEILEQSKCTNQVYISFHHNKIHIQSLGNHNLNIFTLNNEISNMIHSLANSMNINIDLYWNNNNWYLLGKLIAQKIKRFINIIALKTSFHEIRDANTKIFVELNDESSVVISLANDHVLQHKDKFYQENPFWELTKGIAEGLGIKIYVYSQSVEELNKIWKNVYSYIGFALKNIMN